MSLTVDKKISALIAQIQVRAAMSLASTTTVAKRSACSAMEAYAIARTDLHPSTSCEIVARYIDNK
jgi:hypothetical protein